MRLLKIKFLSFLCFITFFNCSAQKDLSAYETLLGTWKVENKTTYESWTKISDSEYKGESYKLIASDKKVSEYLSMHVDGDTILYKATVLNQNQGSTIVFTLNRSVEDMLSFENLNHDFPKKIQYKIINNDKILVSVLGDNDQGFSYHLIRQ